MLASIRQDRNRATYNVCPVGCSSRNNVVSTTSKRLKRKLKRKSELKRAAKRKAKRPPASIRVPMHPLEVALLDLRIEYLREQAEKFQFRYPKARSDVVRSLLQSTIETRGLGFPKQGPWHDRLVATIQKYGIPVDWSPVAAKRAREA
jgi:hypothetical protein